MDPGKTRNAKDRDLQGVNAFEKLLPLDLTDITRSRVQEAVIKRADEVAPGRVRRDYSALLACLNAAADLNVIDDAPIPRRIGLPKVRPVSPPPLSDDDLDALVAKMPRRYGLVVKTTAILGLRSSEVIGLRICDVDFYVRPSPAGRGSQAPTGRH